MYFKYKIQNTYMYFKYVFQILVFEILPSTDCWTCLPITLALPIGADSMGAIAPTAKKLWGRCPQVAPTGILLCSRCTQSKDTVKITNVSLWKWKWCADDFSLKMHQKRLAARLAWPQPGPAWGAYSTLPGLLAGFKGNRREEEGERRQKGGTGEEGGDRKERRDGRERKGK